MSGEDGTIGLVDAKGNSRAAVQVRSAMWAQSERVDWYGQLARLLLPEPTVDEEA